MTDLIKAPSPPPGQRDPFDGQTWQGWFRFLKGWVDAVSKTLNSQNYLGTYTVANLPSAPLVPSYAYASNGRKSGETAGNGTGVPVYYSNGQWRVFSTDATVTA